MTRSLFAQDDVCALEHHPFGLLRGSQFWWRRGELGYIGQLQTAFNVTNLFDGIFISILAELLRFNILKPIQLGGAARSTAFVRSCRFHGLDCTWPGPLRYFW